MPRADVPMSARARMLLGCAGAPVLIVALLAFAAPQSTIDLWPWTLAPLTARIVATVTGPCGSLCVSVAIHGGKTAARILLEAHALGLAFLLLAGGRGHGNIDWTNPLAVILFARALGMPLIDIGTLARARGDRPQARGHTLGWLRGADSRGSPGWLRPGTEPTLTSFTRRRSPDWT